MGTRLVHIASLSLPEVGSKTDQASPSRLRWLELGLGLVVIATPLAFIPASRYPFADVKLVTVLAGTFAIWAGVRGPVYLAFPAAAWVGALALAALLGADRWWSLTGPENQSNGLLLLGVSAFVLVAATAVPAAMRNRIAYWLVGSSTVIAAISVLYRLWPGGFSFVGPGVTFEGGTLGHPVFLAGMCAAGIVASVGLRNAPTRILIPVIALQATALSFSTKRVGWVALALGLALALWRGRAPGRRAALIVGVVVATLASWAVLQTWVLRGDFVSGVSRFAELRTDSALARTEALSAFARAWSKRPVLGWGPGNTWGAYLASANDDELRAALTGLGDAHNFFVEAAVTTGAVGLLALLVLVAVTVRHVRRGPPQMGWAAGCAAALAAVHLLQPINVTLTPLLFLMTGLAGPTEGNAGADVPDPATRPRLPMRAARSTLGVLLAGGVALSTALLGASVLELHGRTYASEWSLRAAVALAPTRVSSAEALAMSLAVDARLGDDRAGREATALVKETVRRHPWHPGVRLIAANVHLLLRDPHGARTWVKRHMERFPHDPVQLPPAIPGP